MRMASTAAVKTGISTTLRKLRIMALMPFIFVSAAAAAVAAAVPLASLLPPPFPKRDRQLISRILSHMVAMDSTAGMQQAADSSMAAPSVSRWGSGMT